MKKFFKKLVSIISAVSILASAANIGSAKAVPPFLASINKFFAAPVDECTLFGKGFCERWDGMGAYSNREVERIKKLTEEQLNTYLKSQIAIFESLSPGLFQLDRDAVDRVDSRVLALSLAILNKFFATYPNIMRYMVKEKINLTVGWFEKPCDEKGFLTAAHIRRYITPALNKPYWRFEIEFNTARYGVACDCWHDAAESTFHEMGHMIEYLYLHQQNPCTLENELYYVEDERKEALDDIRSKEGESDSLFCHQIYEVECKYLEKLSRLMPISSLKGSLEKFHKAVNAYGTDLDNNDECAREVLLVLHKEYCNEVMDRVVCMCRALDRLEEFHCQSVKDQMLDFAGKKCHYKGDGFVTEYGETGASEWFAELYAKANTCCFKGMNLYRLCNCVLIFVSNFEKSLAQ